MEQNADNAAPADEVKGQDAESLTVEDVRKLVDKWPKTLPLAYGSPIPDPEKKGEFVTKLEFREPTAADIESCGSPVSVTVYERTPRMVYDAPAMSAMMARLAGVHPMVIRRMSSRDWNNGASLLAYFFLPTM